MISAHMGAYLGCKLHNYVCIEAITLTPCTWAGVHLQKNLKEGQKEGNGINC